MLQNSLSRLIAYFGKISIAASCACALHCVLLPLVFTTLPLFGIEVIENSFLELSIISISLAVGGWAVWKGYKKHHRKVVPVLFSNGITLMIIGKLVALKNIEVFIILLGAVVLVAAHIYNWRKCNQRTIAHSCAFKN